MPTPEERFLQFPARVALGVFVGALSAWICGKIWGGDVLHLVLLGWVVAIAVLLVPLWIVMGRADADTTRSYVHGTGHTHTLTDVSALIASVASLAGVAAMVAIKSDGGTRILEALLCMATVASGWLLVHTIYTLRYARHYYNAQPECIDFIGPDAARFSDFAYLSFTLGMTYQVSDTNLKTSRMRSIVLGHCLLSYLFGAGVIAATINLVVGLAG